MKKYIYLLGTALLCTACGHAQASKEEKMVKKDTITRFVYPTIPEILESNEERAAYLAKHYWEQTNFADTNYVHHPEVTEQAWVDFIDLLDYVPPQTADEAIRNALERSEASRKCFLYLTELADKYLYDPNSPMRNEERYICVLDRMLASSLLSNDEKIRPQARRELAQRNRLGTSATDFTYTLASGRTGRLYDIRAAYTLLFINNPGCHACTETIQALKSAPSINRLQQEGKLKVLALYPDEELDEWQKHRDEFPSEWINGYDKKLVIKEKNLYDLKAIPTLYLLDAQKRVLLKDATAEEIENYLRTSSTD